MPPYLPERPLPPPPPEGLAMPLGLPHPQPSPLSSPNEEYDDEDVTLASGSGSGSGSGSTLDLQKNSIPRMNIDRSSAHAAFGFNYPHQAQNGYPHRNKRGQILSMGNAKGFGAGNVSPAELELEMDGGLSPLQRVEGADGDDTVISPASPFAGRDRSKLLPQDERESVYNPDVEERERDDTPPDLSETFKLYGLSSPFPQPPHRKGSDELSSGVFGPESVAGQFSIPEFEDDTFIPNQPPLSFMTTSTIDDSAGSGSRVSGISRGSGSGSSGRSRMEMTMSGQDQDQAEGGRTRKRSVRMRDVGDVRVRTEGDGDENINDIDNGAGAEAEGYEALVESPTSFKVGDGPAWSSRENRTPNKRQSSRRTPSIEKPWNGGINHARNDSTSVVDGRNSQLWSPNRAASDSIDLGTARRRSNFSPGRVARSVTMCSPAPRYEEVRGGVTSPDAGGMPFPQGSTPDGTYSSRIRSRSGTVSSVSSVHSKRSGIIADRESTRFSPMIMKRMMLPEDLAREMTAFNEKDMGWARDGARPSPSRSRSISGISTPYEEAVSPKQRKMSDQSLDSLSPGENYNDTFNASHGHGIDQIGGKGSSSVNSYASSVSLVSTREIEGRAVDMHNEGESKVVDVERVGRWGGVAAMIESLRNERNGVYDGGVIDDLSGSTHVLLSGMAETAEVYILLEILLPVISNTILVLDISHNHLRAIPEALGRCRALEELNLSGNPLRELPAWMSELRSLRVLGCDNCGLKANFVNMMNARLLHTLCIRNNRMISLPSWLSQLQNLETLLVDGNPFVGPWLTLSEAIVTSRQDQQGQSIPSRSPIFRAREMSSEITPISSSSTDSSNPVKTPFTNPSAHTSILTVLPLPGGQSEATPTSTISPSMFMATPTEGSFTMVRNSEIPSLRGLVARELSNGSAVPEKKTIKRIKSAGALLKLAKGNDNRDSAAAEVPRQPPPSSFGQSRMTTPDPTASTDDDSDNEGKKSRSSSRNDNTTRKNGKWGFLRKMSVSQLRTKGAASSQAAPPLPVPPPKLQHADSVPQKIAEAQRERPILRSFPHSTATLPIRGVMEPVKTNEFGGTSSVSMGRQTKRRSFLPVIEGPPALNVAIPVVSNTSFNLSSLSLLNLMGSPLQPPIERPRDVSNASSSNNSQVSEHRRNISYEVGLRSLMSYLGDLYDLALPIPTAVGGAEVIASEPDTGSVYIAGGSSRPPSSLASPLPLADGHMIMPASLRRRQTLETSNSNSSRGSPVDFGTRSGGSCSTHDSMFQRPPSVARPPMPEITDIKRNKDDPVMRKGVIKHIIDTERTYIGGLQDLVDIYVKPACEAISRGSNETVVPLSERKIVFGGGIESILAFHRDSFLPSLEKVARETGLYQTDPSRQDSREAARRIAEVFQRFHPFMRQYSTYINNFDYASLRSEAWMEKASSSPSPAFSGRMTPVSTSDNHTPPMLSAAAVSAGLGLAAAMAPNLEKVGGGLPSNQVLTMQQRKRIRSYMKHARKHPRHTQLNLQSYLLLPVQRIPRYRMLLEDLARATPPDYEHNTDSIEQALSEMVALASSMNEEKRDSESRRKLVKWQQRIRGRFATPLVQAHRRLLLDGSLNLDRLVKRTHSLIEFPSSLLEDPRVSPGKGDSPNGNDNDRTITGTKTIVQIESLGQEVTNRKLSVILTSDLMILCREAVVDGPGSSGGDKGEDGMVELDAVLKLQTKRKPASLMNGTGIRLVDNRNILYLSAPTAQEAAHWVRTINTAFNASR